MRRVARLEHRALRSLRRKARAGACDVPEPAPVVEATRVSGSLPAPTAAAPRQEVKGVSESKGGARSVIADSGPNLHNLAPMAGAEAAVRAGRSYADDHPARFALAILVTLLCALLLVRELRRDPPARPAAPCARGRRASPLERTSTSSNANVVEHPAERAAGVEAHVLAERVEVRAPSAASAISTRRGRSCDGRREEQAAAGPQHAPGLGQQRGGVGDVLEHLRAPHEVDARVLQRDLVVRPSR